MFGSVVLEVAIGLVFVYGGYALACSAIVEFLESVRGQRGRQLAIALERMLGAELKARFYRHGLIQSLSKSGRLPSYLPTQKFAAVTLDLLGVSAAQFRQQLDALPGEVGDTLRALTKDAKTYEHVVLHLEQWFDQTMDRCSGWFRRRARMSAFVTGLVVAALLNVDSLEIASTLYADTHLRLSVVTEAEAEGQVPIGRRTAERGPTVMNMPIESGTLPLGWENSRFATRAQWADHAWVQPAFWFGPVLTKVLGLIATALAGSLGAAFWFEALKRLLALRSTLTSTTATSIAGSGSGISTMLAVSNVPARSQSVSRSLETTPTTLAGLATTSVDGEPSPTVPAPGNVEVDPIVSLDGKPST